MYFDFTVNAMMLLCVVLLNDYCKPSRHGDHVIVTSNPNSCDEITPLQRTTCIQILVCAEAIIIVPILVCYLGTDGETYNGCWVYTGLQRMVYLETSYDNDNGNSLF